MGNSRTPRRTSEPLRASLELALEPWLVSGPASGSQPGPASTPLVALAFSGGLDSTVLLHAACRLLKPLGVPLLAIHVNHGLSPNAAHWSAFCQTVCEQLAVPFCACVVTVPAEASIEAAARTVRYQALVERAEMAGAALLVTAHHGDDQAETVLLNLLRGTGIPGLRGIAATRTLDAVTLLRPWLSHSRRDLEDYAALHALQWIEDESNRDDAFKRNALRHHALPVLKNLAPDLIERLGSLARHAQADAFLLDELARLDMDAARRDTGLDVAMLTSLDPRRAANLLRYWLKSGGYGTPSEATLGEWLIQIATNRHAVILQCGGTRLAIRFGALIALTSATDRAALPEAVLQLTWLGEAALMVPAWRGQLHFDAASEAGISVERLRSASLTLRPRNGGERIQLNARAPSRTLKNLYQEAGIAQIERSALPLMYCDDDLVYAAGLGMNLRACSAAEERIHLRWVPNL